MIGLIIFIEWIGLSHSLVSVKAVCDGLSMRVFQQGKPRFINGAKNILIIKLLSDLNAFILENDFKSWKNSFIFYLTKFTNSY